MNDCQFYREQPTLRCALTGKGCLYELEADKRGCERQLWAKVYVAKFEEVRKL